jgi:autoinducer 2 (AI-2) kinase
MTSRYLLAIDAGTGSCRAVLFTEAGHQAAVSVREWAHHEPAGVPGGQDFDVQAGWRAIAACVQDALRDAGASGADVAAVAATSMREGVVLYDRAGREIWACPNVDSRSAEEAADLIREGAAEKIYAEAGDWVSITTPARLRWLARHRPDILEATGSLGMLSDWIVYRLSGAQVTEPSCGSSSGMFTLAQRAWSASIPALSGLPPDVLPPVVDPGTVVGQVTPAAAAQTGLRAGTPVVAGGADTQLGLLGAGTAPGEYTVVAGTFWQNTVLLTEPLIDPQARLRTLCHVTPGQWMLEGIGFYCGMSMRWFRDAFCDTEVAAARRRGVDPYVLMEEAAAQVPAGSGGVVAIMSNLMNARRWRARQPGVRRIRPEPPGGQRPGGLHPGPRGGRGLRGPGPPGHHHRADRAALRGGHVHRRRGQGAAVAPDHGRRARRAGARAGDHREQRARRRAVRRPRRGQLRQPG